MTFVAPPPSAAWRHRGARTGFEVAYFARTGSGYRIEGSTTAVEGESTWIVTYELGLDSRWVTRHARVSSRSGSGPRSVLLEADGAGRWRADGVALPELDGCLDVDLESSALTNAFPILRSAPSPGVSFAAPAAYVRAADCSVGRLEQQYARTADRGADRCFDYRAPAFDFACRLVYDGSGLVRDYPGIAVRVA